MRPRAFDRGIAAILRKFVLGLALGAGRPRRSRPMNTFSGRGAARARKSATSRPTLALVLGLTNTHSA